MIFIIFAVLGIILLPVGVYYSVKATKQFNDEFQNIIGKIESLKKFSEESLRNHRDLLLSAMIKSQTSADSDCSEIVSKVIKTDERCGNQIAAQCDDAIKQIVQIYVTHPFINQK